MLLFFENFCYLLPLFGAEGFQRFDSIDKAADELRVQPLLRDTAMQLENEQAHARRILWWTAGAIGIALFMLAEFVGMCFFNKFCFF